MIYISKDECINPEAIESMIFHNEGIQIFMVSGRLIQVVIDVGRIISEIEDYWSMKAPKIVAEQKPAKRKYTKKVKKANVFEEDGSGVETL